MPNDTVGDSNSGARFDVTIRSNGQTQQHPDVSAKRAAELEDTFGSSPAIEWITVDQRESDGGH
jgi:hypothetical protein